MSEIEKTQRFNENYIFIQAFLLYKKAKKEEGCNFINALNLYKQAVSHIESIPEKFPASDLAVKIAQQNVTLGMDTIEQVNFRIDALREKARKEELLTILHDCAINLEANDLKAEMLEELALLFWENNQHKRALKFFSEANDAIDYIDIQSKKNNCLNRLALKYAEVNEFERALLLSAFLSDLSDQIRLLTELGCSYFKQKQKELAIQLFNNSLELIERSDDRDLKDANLAWISYKLGESLEFYWAIEVCETIQEPETRMASLQQIASCLVEVGQLGNIKEIIKLVSDNRIKSELMATLVSKYANQGYFAQAREIVDTIAYPSFKARALLSIAFEYKGKQLSQVATGLISESLELNSEINDHSEQVLILASAISLSNKFNDRTSALKIANTAIAKVEKLENNIQKAELLTYIQECVLNIGELELAKKILGKISAKSMRSKAVVNISIKLSELDHFNDAIKALNEISDIYERLNAFFQLIRHNPGNRNFKKKFDLIAGTIRIAEQLEDIHQKDTIMSECSVFMAKFEKFHFSLQTLEKITSDQIRDETIWKLANIKFNSGFFTEGIEIMRLIMDNDKKVSGLIKIGIKLLTKQYPDTDFGPTEFLPIAFSFWLEESNRD